MGDKPDQQRELRIAKSVLTRAVVGPQMKAIRRLLKAREAAADPEQVRAAARREADELVEHARRKGRELREQAEADIAASHRGWAEAYGAALDAGWTVELLTAAEQPPPPAKARGRRGGRRSLSREPATRSVGREHADSPPSRPEATAHPSALGPSGPEA